MLESAIIDEVELYEVEIPFKEPFEISGGVSHTRRSLIILLKSDGVVGYGESAPFEFPFYSSETLDSVKNMLISYFFPMIVGRKVNSIEELNEILNRNVRGNNFAKAGVETAYWDLIARKNAVPLKELLRWKMERIGVPAEYTESRGYVESGISIGIPVDRDLGRFREAIEKALEDGYKRVKVKIKPGWDIEPLKISREILGYDFPLWTDANGAYTLDHVDLFLEMDRYECLFHEQPLHVQDYLGNLELANRIKTPICLDESLKSELIARQVLKLNISRIWNLKIQRVGGLLEALKIYKIAVENQVKLWGGTMPETGLGASFILCFASFAGFVYPSDVEPSSRWFEDGRDIVDLRMQDGRIKVPNDPGIGEISEDRIVRFGKKICTMRGDTK